MISYLGRENDWPYQQIADWEDTEDRLGLLIRRATNLYPENESYAALWKSRYEDRLKNRWQILVYPLGTQ